MGDAAPHRTLYAAPRASKTMMLEDAKTPEERALCIVKRGSSTIKAFFGEPEAEVEEPAAKIPRLSNALAEEAGDYRCLDCGICWWRLGDPVRGLCPACGKGATLGKVAVKECMQCMVRWHGSGPEDGKCDRCSEPVQVPRHDPRMNVCHSCSLRWRAPGQPEGGVCDRCGAEVATVGELPEYRGPQVIDGAKNALDAHWIGEADEPVAATAPLPADVQIPSDSGSSSAPPEPCPNREPFEDISFTRSNAAHLQGLLDIFGRLYSED